MTAEALEREVTGEVSETSPGSWGRAYMTRVRNALKKAGVSNVRIHNERGRGYFIVQEPETAATRDEGPRVEIETFDLEAYLLKEGLEYIDKRPMGGRLWVVGGEKLAPLLPEGVRFQFSPSGGKATGNRAGWWTAWPKQPEAPEPASPDIVSRSRQAGGTGPSTAP